MSIISDNEEMILKLYNLGAPDRAIARIIGYNQRSISIWRKSKGLPIHQDILKWWNNAKQKGQNRKLRWEDEHKEDIERIIGG